MSASDAGGPSSGPPGTTSPHETNDPHGPGIQGPRGNDQALEQIRLGRLVAKVTGLALDLEHMRHETLDELARIRRELAETRTELRGALEDQAHAIAQLADRLRPSMPTAPPDVPLGGLGGARPGVRP